MGLKQKFKRLWSKLRKKHGSPEKTTADEKTTETPASKTEAPQKTQTIESTETKAATEAPQKTATDSEVSAEEVIEKEIFPQDSAEEHCEKPCKKTDTEAAEDNPSKPAAPKKRQTQSGAKAPAKSGAKSGAAKSGTSKSSAAAKATSGKGKKNGTRPTNPEYEMIDATNATADTSKS